MKNLTFILVVKFDSQSRRDNFERSHRFILNTFPDSHVIIKHYQETPFYRTRYINEALSECKTEYAAIWDVDIIIQRRQIEEAVKKAAESALVYPYTLPWCNIPEGKKHLAAEELLLQTEVLTDNKIKASVGGCYVCHVKNWLAMGGENEAFVDWGPEDRERFFRFKILKGKNPLRVEGPLFHMVHAYTNDSTWQQPYFEGNANEFQRIVRMTRKELENEILKWPERVINVEIKVDVIGDTQKKNINKIITRFGIEDDNKSGRLGNKMFQAAACIGHAEKHGYELILPEWRLKDIFDNIKTSRELKEKDFVVYKEPCFEYSKINERMNNLALEGYFQSEKYFKHCEGKIRSHYFKPDRETHEYARKIYNQLSNNGELMLTVIQVRRDDYLQKSDYHTVQSLDYYEQAIKRLKPLTDLFVVFCDKSAEHWCRQVFDDMGITWVMAPQDNYIGDIFVMANCDNYIIANSSFGWWGAWLNPRVKTVIAPKNWFGPAAGLNDKDICPEGWVRI